MSTLARFSSWIRKPRESLPLLIPMAISAGLLLLTILQGYRNFDSDQSLAGLMALHLLKGEFPVYVWNQGYFGMIFLPFTLLALLVMGKTSIVATRLVMLASCLLFEIILYFGVKAVWGKRIACATLLFIAIPSMYMMRWFGFHVYPMYAPLAIGILWTFVRPHLSSNERTMDDVILAGLLTGIALWLSPVFGGYIVIFILLALRSTKESVVIMKQMYQLLRRPLSAAIIGIIALVVLTAIVQQWFWFTLTPDLYAKNMWKACVMILLHAILWILVVSDRKKYLLSRMGGLLAGFFVGAAPIWWYAYKTGVLPSSGMYVAGAQVTVAKDFFLRIIPSIISAPPIKDWVNFSASFPEQIFIYAGIIAGLILLVVGLLRLLRTSLRLLKAEPLDTTSILSPFVAGLLILVLLSAYLRGAMHQGQTRFIIDAWPVAMLTMALGWDVIRKRTKILATALIVLSLSATGYCSMRFILFDWSAKGHILEPANIEALETFLTSHNVKGGYGNYWTTYVLMFLMEERVQLAPWAGNNRYKPYSDAAWESNPYAVILHPGHDRVDIPMNETTIEALVAAEKSANFIELYYTPIQKRIEQSTVVDRAHIGRWDVWILADPPSRRP